MKSVKILSIPLHAVSRQEALVSLADFIASGKSHQVTTVNSEFIMIAQSDAAFRTVLQEADLSLADSSGVMWAARFTGHYLPERIPGADLIHDIAAMGAERKWKLYLVGAAKGVAERAGAVLEKMHPGVVVVGAEAGLLYRPNAKTMFDETEVAELAGRIRKAKPDVLLVAFGAPKQDLFIAKYKKELGVPVMVGVGGSFDFLAGKVKRAPAIWRKLWLEWLWRLFQEPKRFKRIWTAVVLFPLRVIFAGLGGR